uniref:Tetraspanin n=1 Tax=Knipowitschia caucasica TaxID=637954 RepID=A0AAV2KL80_KNICA
MWGLVTKESFAQENIGAIAADPMLVLVSAGLFLFALCVFGCVAVLRENLCLMKTFALILVVLISIEALLVIFVEFFKNEISASMRSSMLAGIVRYQDDLDVKFIMDEIQSNLQCCGVDTYRDWQLNIYYNCSAPGVLACGVPPTCCVDPLENGTVWNSQCGVGALAMDEFTAQSVVFLGGCLGSLSRWAEEHRLAIVIPEGLVFAVQILGVFIIARLMDSIYSYQKHIKNYYRPRL